MSVPEDKNRETPVETTHVPVNGEPQAPSGADTVHTSYEQTTDHDYDSHFHSDESHHDDPYMNAKTFLPRSNVADDPHEIRLSLAI